MNGQACLGKCRIKDCEWPSLSWQKSVTFENLSGINYKNCIFQILTRKCGIKDCELPTLARKCGIKDCEFGLNSQSLILHSFLTHEFLSQSFHTLRYFKRYSLLYPRDALAMDAIEVSKVAAA